MNMTTDFEAPAGPSRELAEYLEIPLRYPFHFFLPFLGIVLLALLVFTILPRKYQSFTLIMVESDRASAAMDTSRLRERLSTIKQEIDSRTRLEQIIEELGPYERYGEIPLYWQVAEMRRATQVRVQGNDAFSIAFVHRDPEMAMKVTNRLASLFIENTGKLREAAVREARGFTASSLAESKALLDQAALDVQAFKKRYMGALPEQLESNLATLSRLVLDRQTVEASIQAAENRRDFLLNTIVSQNLPSMKSGAAKELVELEKKLAELRLRYTDQHPDIEALLSRMRSLETSFEGGDRLRRETAANASAVGRRDVTSPGDEAPPRDGAADVFPDLDLSDPNVYALYSNLERTNQELHSLTLSRRRMEERIAEFQERVELTPRIEPELYSLQKEYALRRENYELMSRRNLEAEMAARLEAHWGGDLFRILDPAHLPERPISPNGLMLLGGGFFFGLFAGIVIAAIVDYLDRSVKTVRQLESLVPIPVLATVPQVKRMGRRARIYA